jgi:hypothetical protein
MPPALIPTQCSGVSLSIISSEKTKLELLIVRPRGILYFSFVALNTTANSFLFFISLFWWYWGLN